MDSDEKDSKEKPTKEAASGGNVQNRSDDNDDEKIADEDLENATDRVNAKAKRQWLEYERSLTPPQQAMEDLRLRGVNSPGASTSGIPNENRTSHPKARKKGKRSNNINPILPRGGPLWPPLP